MMPEGAIRARKQICRDSCDKKCPAYADGAVPYDNPQASCPRRGSGWILAWGCWGDCNNTPPMPPSRPPALSEPTVMELAANFVGAMERWATAGFPVADKAVYAARSAVCDTCEFWDGTARFGLGKCKAPGCGCTSMKRWLATERCPLNKWPK